MQKKKDFIIKSIYYSIVFAIIFLIYRFSVNYLLPFIISFTLVFILRKPSMFLAKKLNIKVKYINIVLVIFSFVFIFVIMGLFIFFVVKKIDMNSVVTHLVSTLTEITGRVTTHFHKLENYLPQQVFSALHNFADNIPSNLGDTLTNWLSNFLSVGLSAAPKFLLSFIVTVVAGCYFSNEYEPLKNFFISVVPRDKQELLVKIKKVFKNNVLKLIKGYSVISLVVFAVIFVGMLIKGDKNAFWISLIVVLIDLLPVLGAGIILVPWSIIYIISGEISTAVILLLTYFGILAVHHVLEPKFIGKSIGVPPLITLVVMFISLKMLGFIGMIVSVITLITVVSLYTTDM